MNWTVSMNPFKWILGNQNGQKEKKKQLLSTIVFCFFSIRVCSLFVLVYFAEPPNMQSNQERVANIVFEVEFRFKFDISHLKWTEHFCPWFEKSLQLKEWIRLMDGCMEPRTLEPITVRRLTSTSLHFS